MHVTSQAPAVCHHHYKLMIIWGIFATGMGVRAHKTFDVCTPCTKKHHGGIYCALHMQENQTRRLPFLPWATQLIHRYTY